MCNIEVIFVILRRPFRSRNGTKQSCGTKVFAMCVLRRTYDRYAHVVNDVARPSADHPGPLQAPSHSHFYAAILERTIPFAVEGHIASQITLWLSKILEFAAFDVVARVLFVLPLFANVPSFVAAAVLKAWLNASPN